VATEGDRWTRVFTIIGLIAQFSIQLVEFDIDGIRSGAPFLKIARISKQAIKEINYFILFCTWAARPRPA
jgi:hypothetical protein